MSALVTAVAGIHASSEIYKSRWGFHPVSYEDYLKLKKLAQKYRLAYSKHRKLERWMNKAERNRRIRHRISNGIGQTTGYNDLGPQETPSTDPCFTSYNGWIHSGARGVIPANPEFRGLSVISDYNNARMPKARPEDVVPITISMKQVDDLLDYGEPLTPR